MEFIHNHQNRTQVAQELTSLPWRNPGVFFFRRVIV